MFGSLFSGIGGLDMALEACGGSPAWQVENDSFCTKVLERHWPDVTRYGDIREVDWQGVERVELVCAGFPCQPISVAGQNRGEDDERNMWPETYRAIRELGPRYVFLENVPGLLAHGYFGRILGDLAQGGYDAVWDTFTATGIGASHRRERLFILAYARQERLESSGAIGELGRVGLSLEGKPVAHASINLRRTLGDDARETSNGAGDRDVANADPGRHGEPSEALCAGGRAHLNGSSPLGHPEGDAGARRAEPAGRAGQALPGRSGAAVADAADPRREDQGQHNGGRSSLRPRPT